MSIRNKSLWTSVAVGVVISAGALAGNVTLPYSFTAGTPSRAAEVNANFAAVKQAVDDNQTQINALLARVAALEAPPQWTGVTFSTGWGSYNTTLFQSGQFAKEGSRVHLRGLVRRATGTEAVVFQLPLGFRPAMTESFWVLGGGPAGAQVDVRPSGDVVFISGDPAVLQLSGISFSTP